MPLPMSPLTFPSTVIHLPTLPTLLMLPTHPTRRTSLTLPNILLKLLHNLIISIQQLMSCLLHKRFRQQWRQRTSHHFRRKFRPFFHCQEIALYFPNPTRTHPPLCSKSFVCARGGMFPSSTTFNHAGNSGFPYC